MNYYLNRSRTRIMAKVFVTVKRLRRINGKPYTGQRIAVMELEVGEEDDGKALKGIKTGMRIATNTIIAVYHRANSVRVKADERGQIHVPIGKPVQVMREGFKVRGARR